MRGDVIAAIAVVLLFVLLFLLSLRRAEIHVEFNPSGSAAALVARMSSLKCSYAPTPWLLGSTLQTIYGMRYRKRPSSAYKTTREILGLRDGGQIGLDFYPTSVGDDAPVVVILPTMGGSAREPCVAPLADICARRGWRAVVANGRGGGGVAFASSQLTFSIDSEPIGDAVAFLRTKYRPKFVFVVGFSMGAIRALCHAAWDGGGVDGYAVVSHAYDPWRTGAALENAVGRWLFAPLLVSLMRRQVMRNSFIPDEDKDFTGVKSMHDFDVKIGHKYRGNTPESSERAFSAGAARFLVGKVRAPILMLSADNDPFTLEKLAPSEEVRRSDKTVLVRTKEGGHVSFLYGWLGRKSLIDDIVPEWFDQIMRSAAE